MLRPACLSVLLAAAALPAQPPAAPAYKIVAADHQTIDAKITQTVQTTNYVVTRWVAFVPEPPDLPGQAVTKVTVSPKATAVTEAGPLARKLRVIDTPVAAPAPGAKMSVEVGVQATLRSRKLVALADGEAAPKVSPLTAAEAKYYTSPGPTVDFDHAAVKAWVERKKLKLGKGEDPVALATRALDALREDFNYSYSRGRNKASEAVVEPTSDGAGLSYLFVAAMRANKVPARPLCGRLAMKRKADSKPGEFEHDWYHVRAEFHLAGVGWVPVNPGASVLTSGPVRDLIGNDAGDFLALHADVDVRLPFPNRPRVVPTLSVGASIDAFGRGPFDAAAQPSGWDFTATPSGVGPVSNRPGSARPNASGATE
jgi:transglutaminase-like putative cysteine protease